MAQGVGDCRDRWRRNPANHPAPSQVYLFKPEAREGTTQLHHGRQHNGEVYNHICPAHQSAFHPWHQEGEQQLQQDQSESCYYQNHP